MVRPSIVFGAFKMMLSAGDGFMSMARRAGWIRSACPSMPSPSSTRSHNSSSMFARWPSIRRRMAIVDTLLNSKVKALTMWRCSGSDMERQNSRGWL